MFLRICISYRLCTSDVVLVVLVVLVVCAGFENRNRSFHAAPPRAMPPAAKAASAPLANAAAAAADKEKVPIQIRVLCGILLGKRLKADNFDQRVMHTQMEQVALMVRDIIAKPELITQHQVLLNTSSSSGVMNQSTTPKQAAKVAEQMNVSLCFDANVVKTFADVPAPWLWGLLQKLSVKFPLTNAEISLCSKKGAKQLRTGLAYLSGAGPRSNIYFCVWPA
jgi:hypothetical protein